MLTSAKIGKQNGDTRHTYSIKLIHAAHANVTQTIEQHIERLGTRRLVPVTEYRHFVYQFLLMSAFLPEISTMVYK
jgi:hypothetical protein